VEQLAADWLIDIRTAVKEYPYTRYCMTVKKYILPTLGNEFIVLIKETSVVSFIAVTDITKAFRAIGDANYEYVIPYIMLALVYLVLVMIITLGIKMMERRFKRSERTA